MNNKEVKLVNSMKKYIISLEKTDDQDRSRSLCIRNSQNEDVLRMLNLSVWIFIYDSYIMETLYLYNITVNN